MRSEFEVGCREHGGLGYGADISAVQEAHESGLSLGKYAACQILLPYDSFITPEDCHNMTMSEIHGLIEEHENEHDTALLFTASPFTAT